MSELKDNLDLILQEKDTKLLPQNIKNGIKILGVTGTLLPGTDTSDATATANDIMSPKTAYVNGQKIKGSINAEYEQSTGTEFEDRNVGQYLVQNYYGTIFSEDGLMYSNFQYSSSNCGYRIYIWDGTNYVYKGYYSFDYYPYAVSAFGYNGNPDECLMAGHYWSSSSYNAPDTGVYKFNKATLKFTMIYNSKSRYLNDIQSTAIFLHSDNTARIVGRYSGTMYYANVANDKLVNHFTYSLSNYFPVKYHFLNKNVILGICNNNNDAEHYRAITRVFIISDSGKLITTKDFPGILACSRSSDYCIYNGIPKRLYIDTEAGVVELIDIQSSINIPIPTKDTSDSYYIDAGILYDKIFYTCDSKTSKIEIYNIDITNDTYSKYLSVYGVYAHQKEMCIPYDVTSTRNHGKNYVLLKEGTDKLVGFTINGNIYRKISDGNANSKNISSGKIAYNQYGKVIGILPTDIDDYNECLSLSGTILGEDNYIELEYLDNTGTQFINLNKTTTANFGFELDMTVKTGAGYNVFGGNAKDANTTFVYFGLRSDKRAYNWQDGDTAYWVPFADTMDYDNRHTYKCIKTSNGFEYYYDNALIKTVTTQIQPVNCRMALFSFMDSNGIIRSNASEIAKCRFYSLKLYDGETLTNNYIPVKQVYSGEIGIYDTITDTFFKNLGLGEFVAGPEISGGGN